MEKNYSEVQVREMLNATAEIVSAERDLAHWISGDRMFAREHLARTILNEILPRYLNEVPEELRDKKINSVGIEKRCKEAIRINHGRSYKHKVMDY